MTHLYPPVTNDEDTEDHYKEKKRIVQDILQMGTIMKMYRPKTEDHHPRTAPSPKSAQTASYREPSLPPEEERLRRIEEKLLALEASMAVPKAGCGGTPPIAPLRSDEIEFEVSWVFVFLVSTATAAAYTVFWVLSR